MSHEPRGRIEQDSEFVFSEFDGLKIEQLVVSEKVDTHEPIIIFLKVEGKNWHQYFLDAGIGFWEDWEWTDLSEEEDEDPDTYALVDFTEKFRLANQTISKIICEVDSKNSRIIIELKNKGKMILKCINPEIFDSDCELIWMD